MRADWIFVGGPVISVDPSSRVYDGLALKGTRILATGTREQIMALKGPRTEVVELAGRAVTPGLIESHCHMTSYGTNQLGINIKWPNVKSIADIQAKVKEKIKSTPPATWIRGWGYDQTKLAENRHPTRWDLDAISPDHPVLLGRTCGHIAVANSRALAAAGLTDQSPDPIGGKMDRRDGKLTGVVYETAKGPLVDASAFTREELMEGLRVCSEDWLMNGVTSCHDAGGPLVFPSVLQEGVETGKVKVRVYLMVTLKTMGHDEQGRVFARSGVKTGFGNERMRIGPYKVITDGSSSGPTAATRDPYTSNPGDSGMLYFSQEELDELIEIGHAAGYQVSTHAVGDRGVEMTLNAIEKALKKYPRKNCRHRIEHCGICPPDLQKRVLELGIIPIAQPVFFHEFGDGYLRNYGPHRVRHMFPAKTFIANGIPVAASSDCPVTFVDPFLGMYSALTRNTMTGNTCGTEEVVDILSAIRMYTYNGAYASFEENLKGTLEPGKLADVTVMSANLFEVPVEEIKDMKADMTFVGGELVYQRKK